MTRLDPPPHRPNPRAAWMDNARSRDDFSRRSGLKDDREKRESGYFSLGRAAGASTLRDDNPPAPYRHFERGHPIFGTRNVEPKDAVPFRNPNLGMASERQIPEFLNEDLLDEIPPPDPYEIAVEVEARVGPRSPSPTPFKIAESLASSGRKGFGGSYTRGNISPRATSSGRHDSSRQSSALQSRASSPPSRGNSGFGRSESSTSLSRRNFDGGGRTQGTEPASRISFQGTQGRRAESGTLPRNFKSFGGSVKSQSSTVSDFRSALRVNASSSGRGAESRCSSPPLRRDFNSSGQMSPRKTEITSSLSRGSTTRTSSPSPSRRANDSSSPPRRNYGSSSQSILRKSESVTSLNGRGHHGRCGSPIREGYDIESQALLRTSSSRNGLNEQEQESLVVAPTRRAYDAPTQSILRKTESSPAGTSRGRDSRSTSPGRRSYEAPTPFQLRKADAGDSFHGRTSGSRNSSPSRRSHESPSKSPLRKSEFTSSARSRDSYSSVTLRSSHDASDQRLLCKVETSSSLKAPNTRNSSPARKGNSEPPGYSILRCAANGDSSRSFHRKSPNNDTKPESNRSWRGSTHSLRSSSLSRAASPSRQTGSGHRAAFVTLETPKSPGSLRSGAGRRGHDDHCPSPNDRRPYHRARSPSPSPHVQIQRHTSSQSSMESSESGHLSMGSTGRSREEYAALADLPKVKRIHESEGLSYAGRQQNQQPVRRQELFKPASHSLSKFPSREWEDAAETERDWHYGGSGYLSRAHSTTSLQRSGSPTADEGNAWKAGRHRSEQMQASVFTVNTRRSGSSGHVDFTTYI
ncbi:serine/arginine repetitive matrix protein 2 [Mugil cephalus]|uniref:serine/arginine repetitive matrix protein 2 n=1 Tax=Mugil cephalus TaxID=48193 RepID=UPI001FB8233B|nr:serine/arginine repetitive matrix protein 2 [Mugil cephalus]